MKILLATEKPFSEETLELIKQETNKELYSLKILEKYKNNQELIENIKDANALIVRSDIINSDIINQANNLKIIVRAGAGFDNIDLELTKKKGIVVMNTPGQNANAVAELVLGLSIYMSRNTFKQGSGQELKNKKIGILAFGNVGRNTARACKSLRMSVMAYDAFVENRVFKKEGVEKALSMQELFSQNNIVSLHMPLTPNTIKAINYNLVSSMPPNGILINTARKEIIDEDGLIRAMKERTDIRYGTDLMPDADHAFQDFGIRYFSTPKKIGAETLEANANAGHAAIIQIIDYFKTGNETFRVNL